MEKKRNAGKKRMEILGSIRIQLPPEVGFPSEMLTETKHQNNEM